MATESIRSAAEHFMAAHPSRQSMEEYECELTSAGRLTPVVQEAFRKALGTVIETDLVFYIAGALTGVSEEVKQRYVDLSNTTLDFDNPGAGMFGYAPHLHGTDPVRHPNVSPEEVRDIDYLWAGVVANGHINFWDPIAHGNAVEAGWAEQLGIPSLHLVPEGMTTSRLVRGMKNIIGTLVYTDFSTDGLPQIREFFDEVQSQKIGRQ